jgi:hypothetical protein
MKRHFSGWISSLFVLALFTSPLWADKCLDPSPTVLAGQDPYGPINARDLTKTELDQVTALIQSLRGDWIGSGEALYCKSLEDPLDREVVRYALRGRIKTDHFGNLMLTVDMQDIDQRISHQEIFRIYLKDQRLRTEHDGSAGDVELKLLSANRIRFIWRVVIPAGATPGSTRKEYDTTLAGDADNFSISRHIYTQGRLSTRYTWNFHRR